MTEMDTKTTLRKEPHLPEIMSADGIPESEVIHCSDVNIKNEPFSSASLQSDCDIDGFYSEVEINTEPLYLEDTPSESEVIHSPGIHANYKSAHFVSASDCETHKHDNEINTTIDIKEEHEYCETMFSKTKPEQEDSDYSFKREDDTLEENQKFIIIPTRLDIAAEGNCEPGVARTYLICLKVGENSNSQNEISTLSKTHIGDDIETRLIPTAGFQTHTTHGGKRKDVFNICDKSFAESVHLKGHNVDIKTLYECDQCEEYFAQKSNLKKHIIIHEGRRLYKCCYCEKNFTSAFCLKIHKLVHEGKSPYRCDYCGKNVSSASSLKQHKLVHAGKGLYECEHCGKSFVTSSKLKQHILIHEGIKPYNCNQCGKDFTQKSNLNRHILLHEGRKPYKCCYCEKNFTSAFCSKIHKLVHEGKSPYRCDHCGKNFSSASYLKRHKLVHEGKGLYKCEHCGKSFVTSSMLKQHVLIHKGI